LDDAAVKALFTVSILECLVSVNIEENGMTIDTSAETYTRY
jgi:hypothetical protein